MRTGVGMSNRQATNWQSRGTWVQAGFFAMVLLIGWFLIFFLSFEIITGSDLLFLIPIPALLCPVVIGTKLLDQWIISNYYKSYEMEFAEWPRSKKTTWNAYATVIYLASFAFFACVASITREMNKGKMLQKIPKGMDRMLYAIYWGFICVLIYIIILNVFKFKDRKMKIKK